MRHKIFDSEPGDGSLFEALNTIAQILGVVDVVGVLALTVMALLAPQDLALSGLGIRLIWLIMALFLVTGVPALVLAYRGRTPRLSLIFGGAFPVLFMVMYTVITVVFA